MNIFKNNLRKFLLADLVSQFGSGMTMTATNWFVLDKTGSNELVALVFGVNIFSGLIMSIFSGAIVDRFKRKAVIIFSLIMRAMLIAIPMILLSTYGVNKYFLFLLALNNGLGWNLYFPASKGLLQEITSKDNLIKMNSGAEITMQLGLFSAGAVAGVFYKYFGFQAILLTSIATILLGTLIIQTIKIEEERQPQTAKTGFFALTREGASFLLKNVKVLFFGLTMYVPFVAASIYSVILPGFVNDLLKQDSVVYGMVSMFYGVGACVAGLIVIGLSKKMSQRKLIIGGFLASILCGLLMFLNHSVVGAIAITFIVGLCGPGIRTIMYSLIMEIVPNSYMGRVMSVWNVISLSLQLAMTYLIGRTMDKIGVSYGFLFYSAMMVLGVVIYYFSNSLVAEKSKNKISEQPASG